VEGNRCDGQVPRGPSGPAHRRAFATRALTSATPAFRASWSSDDAGRHLRRVRRAASRVAWSRHGLRVQSLSGTEDCIAAGLRRARDAEDWSMFEQYAFAAFHHPSRAYTDVLCDVLGRHEELNNEDLVDALAEIGDPKSVDCLRDALRWDPPWDEFGQLARKAVWARSVRSAPPRRWRSSARLPATRARSRARRRSTSYDARRADRGPPCRLRVGIRTSRDTLTGLPPALRDARVSHPPSSRPARCRARRSARGSRDRRRTAPATGAAA
jgi:hypothetical protein